MKLIKVFDSEWFNPHHIIYLRATTKDTIIHFCGDAALNQRCVTVDNRTPDEVVNKIREILEDE